MLQAEQFHQAFQLVFPLKKLKYLMCAFAFCNLLSLADPLEASVAT